MSRGTREILVHFQADEETRALLARGLAGEAQVLHWPEMAEHAADVLPHIEVLVTSSLTLQRAPDILDRLPALALIQSASAGVDRFPFARIPAQVTVCSAAGALARPVAEHAWALVLALARNVVRHTDAMRSGVFNNSHAGSLLHDKTLGILGLGHIGREVARIGRAFRMHVLGINRSGRSEEPCAFVGTLADLGQVLAEADVAVIALPLNRATRGLIGPGQLARMKEDAMLVNVARGPIVEQGALYRHLKAHPRFRAALDVWWRYPNDRRGGDASQDYPFHELDNFVMTPHVAGNVAEATAMTAHWVATNVRRYLRGEPVEGVVRREDYL
jgi:phosphoglycerate dehydrogenase-like enzyme